MVLTAALSTAVFVGWGLVYLLHGVSTPVATDLVGVLSASRALQAHLGCPYDYGTLSTGLHQLSGVPPSAGPFTFNEPAAVAVVAAPLTHLPVLVAVVIGAVVSSLALLLVGVVLWRLAGRRGHVLVGCAVATALLLNVPSDEGLALIQSEPLLMLASVLAILLIRRDADLVGGLLLGLLTIKPQVVWGVVLALLVIRRWRAVVGVGVTSLVVYALSLAVLPSGCTRTWLSSASAIHELSLGVGLPSSLVRIVSDSKVALGTEVIGLVIGAYAIWRLRHRLRVDELLSAAFAISLIVAIHSPVYDLVFMAPLGAMVARRRPVAAIAFGYAASVAALVDVAVLHHNFPVFLVQVVLLSFTVLGVGCLMRDRDRPAAVGVPWRRASLRR